MQAGGDAPASDGPAPAGPQQPCAPPPRSLVAREALPGVPDRPQRRLRARAVWQGQAPVVHLPSAGERHGQVMPAAEHESTAPMAAGRRAQPCMGTLRWGRPGSAAARCPHEQSSPCLLLLALHTADPFCYTCYRWRPGSGCILLECLQAQSPPLPAVPPLLAALRRGRKCLAPGPLSCAAVQQRP